MIWIWLSGRVPEDDVHELVNQSCSMQRPRKPAYADQVRLVRHAEYLAPPHEEAVSFDPNDVQLVNRPPRFAVVSEREMPLREKRL